MYIQIRIISRTIQYLITFLTIVIIAFMGVFAIPRMIGIEPYIVRSGSMEPVLQTGSVAFIDTRKNVPERGDIIAFYADRIPMIPAGDGADITLMNNEKASEKVVVTHRVLERTAEGYVTKGDANAYPDLETVQEKNVIGTCLWSIPGMARVLQKLEGFGVALLISWIAMLNLLAWFLAKQEQPYRFRHAWASEQRGYAARD